MASTPHQPARGPSLPTNGLPRAPSQKSTRSLPLRKYASSKSLTGRASPRVPDGFAQASGTLRAPGGPKPLQPYAGPSPFRFLVEDEDQPMTPMDVSPVTPRTPRFFVSHRSPTLLPSSPTSPQEAQTIDHHIIGKFSPLEKSEFPPEQGHGVISTPALSPDAVTAQRDLAPAPAHDKPLDEEEYVRYITAEYARIARQHSRSPKPPSSTHSRQHSHSTSHSRQASRGRAVTLPKDVKRLSTRSLSPPRHPQQSSIDRPLATTVVTDPQQHVDHPDHRRNASTASKTSQRLVYHDFAAAKEAREKERLGVTDLQWANYPGKGRNISPFSSDAGNALPKPIEPLAEQPVVAVQSKVTPTPVKPVLFRMGSKLKSGVKGAFAKKPVAQEEEVERITTMHWTEVDY